MKKIICVLIGLVIPLALPLQGYVLNQVETLVQHLNDITVLELYLAEKGDNPISSLATYTSLLMAYMGAEGETKKQIAEALNITLSNDDLRLAFSSLYKYLHSQNKESQDSYKLKIANSLWLEKTFTILAPYKKVISKDFHGEIQFISFINSLNAANIINQWASLQSEGHIKTLIEKNSISSSTKMILTSGIFLKGPWKYPFNAKLTKLKPFLTSKNILQHVPIMHQTHIFPYYENNHFQMVSLPIANHEEPDIALIIFLPKENKLNDVFEYFYNLHNHHSKNLIDLIDQLQDKNIDLFLPQFSLKNQLDFKNFCISIGIKDAFTSQANFSGITKNKDLFISNAFQENFISVDEKGIIATGSTAISFDIKSFTDRETPIPFIANHPFFYFIIDKKTKLILFMGVVNDPSLFIDQEGHK